MRIGIVACAVIAALAVGCSKGSSDGSTSAGQGAAGSNEDAGEAAARAWLATVDAGSYAQSWTDAAGLFKKAVDQATWQKQVEAVRSPLGKVVSRKVSSRKYAKSVPGAPDGDYVILTFDTVFEKKASAVENVTPMKDPDGTWRVSGYFIK
jgi:ABC-type molybdate transport system substrate-binding protein